MTGQVHKYRNVENYPLFLEGDPDPEKFSSVTVDALDFADLSVEQVKLNQSTVDEHMVRVLEPEKENPASKKEGDKS